MSTEQNKALTRRLMEEAFNQGNLTALDELLADNLVIHDPPPGLTPDLEGFKQLFSMTWKATSDRRGAEVDMMAMMRQSALCRRPDMESSLCFQS